MCKKYYAHCSEPDFDMTITVRTDDEATMFWLASKFNLKAKFIEVENLHSRVIQSFPYDYFDDEDNEDVLF